MNRLSAACTIAVFGCFSPLIVLGCGNEPTNTQASTSGDTTGSSSGASGGMGGAGGAGGTAGSSNSSSSGLGGIGGSGGLVTVGGMGGMGGVGGIGGFGGMGGMGGTAVGGAGGGMSAVAPIFADFTATPAAVIMGTPTDVTWMWSYSNMPSPAPTCSIDQNIGAVTPGSLSSLTLNADTTYTLTCTNSAGSAMRLITISAVSGAIAPILDTFTTTPQSVTINTPTNVKWAWTFANSPTPSPTCTIDNGVGSILNGFSSSVNLAATTTYTLTCTNSAGSSMKQVTMMATPPVAPSLATFTATPSPVPYGTPAYVSWQWTYNNMPGPTPTCSIDQGIGTLTNGQARWTTQTGSVTYTLTCMNSAGSDQRQLTMDVSRCGPVGATTGWIETIPAPPTGLSHQTSAVWIGNGLFIYDGGSYNKTRKGAVWNRATGQWTLVSTTNAPQSVANFGLAWTGSRVVLWGGIDTAGIVNVRKSGALYDPATDTWSGTTITGAPQARQSPIVQWTGTHLSVFDGNASTSINFPMNWGTLDSGLWDPVTDTWSVVPYSANAPRGIGTRATWTGNGLLATGGRTQSSTSGWYSTWQSPATTWSSPCTVAHARRWSSLVWAGNNTGIWWGGQDGETGGPYHGDGFRITLGGAACASTPMNTTGAPTARSQHTALWTGDKMILFGGTNGAQTYDDGATYDPVLDQWTPLIAGTPGQRRGHQAFWTGSDMVVWGGTTSSPFAGCIYKP